MRTALVALTCLLAAAASAHAQAPRAVTNGEPFVTDIAAPGLTFSRVFAPVDRIADWPRDGIPYLPVKTAEFERLLRAAQDVAPGAPAAMPRLERARYKATVVGDDLIGSAEFEIAHPGSSTALLTLDPCDLALANPYWAGNQSAIVSLGSGPEGKTALLVETSGRLLLDWSLRGRRDTDGSLHFRLALPKSPLQSLQLTLPKGCTVSSDQGLIHIAAQDDGSQHATIELGGRQPVNLRVSTEDPRGPQTPLSLLRQSMTYDFTTHGVNVSAQLKLDVHQEPLRQIVVLLDASLRPITARYGESLIPYSLITDARGQSRLVLDFSEQPIRGTNRLIQLGLVAALPADGRLRLPGVRAEGLFWQGGSATLVVQAPLSLGRLMLSGCRQVNAAPLPAPLSGESIELQYFTAQPDVEVDIAPRKERLQWASGMSVTLSGGEVKSQTVAELRASQGNRFELEANVQRPWIVDSVESIPAGGIEDWSIEDSTSQTRKLMVRLKKSVQSQRSVRLLLTGRRRTSPLAEALSVDNLQMVDFQDAQPTRRLLSVRTVGPYDLKITCTEEVTRLDPQRLEEADAELFREPLAEISFIVDAAAADWKARLTSRGPRHADVAVQANIRDDVLTESYAVQCTPESTGLESLLIHISQARDERPNWSLAAEGDGSLTARALSTAEQRSAGFGEEGETWEINFRRPKTAAFELRATRSMPLTRPTPVALPSLVGATSQHGTVVVRTTGEIVPAVENRSLTSVPAETPPDDQYTNVVGAYRFDPARDAQASADAPLVVAPGAPDREPSAWAWRFRLDSRYTRDGNASHAATFFLETAGRPRVRMSLPPQAEVRSLWIDDVRGSLVRDAAGAWVVELPLRKRFPTITVNYTTAEGPLGLVSWLGPVAPTIDLPVLSRQTTLWLPPGYVGAASRGNWTGPGEQATWSQRLFGPLGRGALEPAFDPISADHWSRLAGASDKVGPAEAQAVTERLGAALVGMARNPARIDWGQFLAQFESELDKQPGDETAPLFVDGAALAQIGITPRMPLRAKAIDAPAQRAAALLAESGVSLIIGRDAVLLTTAVNVATQADRWSPIAPSIFVSDPGPWAAATDDAGIAGNATYLPAEAWRSQPPPLKTPWLEAAAIQDTAGASPGWTAYRVEWSETDAPRLRVVHRESMIALGWTLFLIVTSGCLWWGAARGERLIVAAGLLGVLALLVPAAYVPPLTGAFLGVVFALVWQLILPMKKATDEECSALEPASSEVASTKTLITGALLVATLVVSGHADEQQTPTAAPIYKVFVPVDDQRQSVGDTSYLPKPLYDELYRRATPTAERNIAWLLETATYRGALTRDMPQSALALADFNAVYELRTLGPKTRVRIPLAAAGINLAPDAARLDGMAIEPTWENDGAALLIDVAEAGPHRLELAMRLTQTSNGRLTGFDVTIPAVATSRLELSLPSDAGEIAIPSARGAVSRDNASGLITAALGVADRLSVRWAEGSARASAPAVCKVDELLWLRLQPGSILLDARLKYRVLSGKIEQLTLTTDPRLRLLPPGEGEPHVGEVRVVAGDPQTVIYDLARPVADEVMIEAKFLLTGTSSIGNLRLPRLEPSGARSTSRSLAVSVDPALQWNETAGDGVAPLPVAEFLTAWGGGEMKPVVAHRLSRGEVSWSLATQPREPELTTRQLLSLDVRGGRAEVAASIVATTSDGYRYQYRLQIPPALQIDSISVHEEEAERPARWSRDDLGIVTVFLAEPASGEQKLVVKGSLPTAVRGVFALPSIRVEGAEMTAHRVLVFRRADALVNVRNVQGLEPDVAIDSAQALAEAMQEGLFDRRAASRVRLVGGWQGSNNVSAATIDVASNAPLVSAVEVIAIEREGEKWLADIECRLNVVAGVLDVVRFALPPEFQGPFEVTPSAAVELVTVPGRDLRHLIIRPRNAIEGQYRVHIRGPVTPVHDRVHVPDVLPLRVEPVTRYVVLPSQAESRQFAWETQGLRAARLPANMVAPASATEPLVYRVEADRFAAELKAVDRVANAPKVRLADVRVARLANGALRGTASFDVEPAGAASCLLEAPDGYRVVSITRAGLPLPIEPAADGRWTLPLSTPQMAQRVEVVFQGQSTPGGATGDLKLEAPRLVGLPVEKTLWTVSGPANDRPAELAGAEVMDPARVELVRMQNTASLVGAAAELAAAAEPADEESRWYQRWARRMAVSRLEFQRQRTRHDALASSGAAGQGELTAADISAAATAEREELRAARQMGVALPTSPTVGALEAGELWAAGLDPEAPLQMVQSDGPAESISIHVMGARSGDLAARLLAALAVALLTSAAVAAYRHGVPGDLGWRWSHALAIIAGLAWWLWLWPSIVGLVIVMVGTVALAIPSGRWLPRFARR